MKKRKPRHDLYIFNMDTTRTANSHDNAGSNLVPHAIFTQQ
jgi:hypothetical protein